jgi:Co/Zn/Cd efflux system component
MNYKKAADTLGSITVVLAAIFIVPSWFLGPQAHDLVVAYVFVVSLSIQGILLRCAMR